MILLLVGKNNHVYDRIWDSEAQKLKPRSEVLVENPDSLFPYLLKTPNVLEWARGHYQCPTLPGVPLENSEANLGPSHRWDNFIAGNEIGTHVNDDQSIISGMTLSLLKDMGYYKVNIDDHEEYLAYGKGAGCNVLSGTCQDNPLTCNAPNNRTICSQDFYSFGLCDKEGHVSNNCSRFHEVNIGDCRIASNINSPIGISTIAGVRFGFGSRCIEGYVSPIQAQELALCFETKCDVEKKEAAIKISGNQIKCTTADSGQKKILSKNGDVEYYIICPDVSKMCVAGLNCPNDCSGKGRCLKTGKCNCFRGFGGEDCSQEVEVEHDPLIIGDCPVGCLDCNPSKIEECLTCEPEFSFVKDELKCVKKKCPNADEYEVGGICCKLNELESKGHCCEKGKEYQSTMCCLEGEVESSGICCPQGKINRNDICCLPSQVGSNGLCCEQGEEESNGRCCPIGHTFANGGCCPSDKPYFSNGVCCRPGEEGSGGSCYPKGQVPAQTQKEEKNETCGLGLMKVGGICCRVDQVNREGRCCNSQCLTCQEGNPDKCSSCSSDFSLVLKDDFCCLKNQNVGFDEAKNNQPKCVTCEEGEEYFNKNTKKCHSCPKSCTLCQIDNQGRTTCSTKCEEELPKNQFFCNSKKRWECKPGTYLNEISLNGPRCEACDSSCKACLNEGRYGCTSCQREGSSVFMRPGKSSGRCYNCADNLPENEGLCGDNIGKADSEAGNLYDEPVIREIQKQYTLNPTRKLGTSPERRPFSAMIKIDFPKPIIQIIKKIEEKRQKFKITDVLKIWIKDLELGKDYTIRGEISADEDGYLIFFSFMKDFGQVVVNLEVIDQTYFVSKWEELQNSRRNRVLQGNPQGLIQAQSTRPKGLVLPSEPLVEKIRARKVAKKDKVKRVKSYGNALGVIVLLAQLVSIILLIWSYWKPKAHLVVNFLRISLFCQFVSKLPLLNINFGIYAESFLDGLFMVESIKIGFGLNHPEGDLRKSMGGKFAEYNIPALSINSGLASIFILVAAVIAEPLLRKNKNLKKKTKVFVGLLIAALIGLTLLNVFFYSLVSVWKLESVSAKSATLASKLSYFYSWIGFTFSLFFLSYIWRHWTSTEKKTKGENQNNDNQATENTPELYEQFRRAPRPEKDGNQAQEPRSVKFLDLTYVLRLFSIAAVIGTLQDFRPIQLLMVVAIQLSFTIQQGFATFSPKVNQELQGVYLNFLPEILIFLALLMISILHIWVPSMSIETIWGVTCLMIITLGLGCLVKFFRFGRFCYLEFYPETSKKKEARKQVSPKQKTLELSAISGNPEQKHINMKPGQMTQPFSNTLSGGKSAREMEAKYSTRRPDEEIGEGFSGRSKAKVATEKPFKQHQLPLLTENQRLNTITEARGNMEDPKDGEQKGQEDGDKPKFGTRLNQRAGSLGVKKSGRTRSGILGGHKKLSIGGKNLLPEVENQDPNTLESRVENEKSQKIKASGKKGGTKDFREGASKKTAVFGNEEIKDMKTGKLKRKKPMTPNDEESEQSVSCGFEEL